MAFEKVMLRDPKDILNPEHTALIIVDMQKDFCNTDGLYAKAGRDVSAVRAIIPNLRKIVDAAREKGVFVVYLQQLTLPHTLSDSGCWLAYKTRDGKSAEYALYGTVGAEIIDELKPLPAEVVVPKYRSNGFHGTFLDQLLRANGVQSVLCCGTTTEGCMMATALEASFFDYYTCILSDCAASSLPEMHETALAFMRTRFRIFTADEVISLWN